MSTRNTHNQQATPHRKRTIWRTSLLAVLAVGIGTAAPWPETAAAQSSGDFTLGTPKASLAVRFGYNLPRTGGSGGSDDNLWAFTREQLTVEKGDFGGIFLGAELGVRVSERFDVTVSAGRSSAKALSEFRAYVDTDDRPIEQTTEFSTLPLTVGIKAFPWKRGRSVGRFAWVPRSWNPYAGVSAGIVRYRFQQYGDFVDFETKDIFSDDFRSEGTTATVHLRAGIEVGVSSTLMLTAESRYAFGSASLGRDFEGFEDLDLTGFQATAGIALRF